MLYQSLKFFFLCLFLYSRSTNSSVVRCWGETLLQITEVNYELIYQLDAIEYLFVYFQLDMFWGLHAHLQEQ